MLETRELVKIYKPKKGVPVVALDKVSITFSEKGMIFLLGKSGSGKSTLLNVLGGLDNYNGGEIIIKGVSSKDFKQKHFDSYRNTYVGFIFQEYNVLDEFSVGANIALAIELQNRKAEDSEVNEILKEVDLEGYANRKPNELSGGQKQRVAIARALVKNPQIIMADEPSGALDSNTGKQIFDTLKKLSKEKLVIVVSHDREFAEIYADRIIELADGKVISDVEVDNDYVTTEEMSFDGNVIELPAGYHITEEDRVKINDYIKSLKEEKTQIKISTAKNKRFRNTDISKIKSQDASSFKLIKSKLPLKNAFKIGAGGLKHKKFRLVITILLSCISFGLFGLADTFAAYNHINACTNSLMDTEVKYVATAKAKKVGSGIDSYWREWGYMLSQDEINSFAEKTNVKMHGVYSPFEADLTFERHTDTSIELSKTDYDIYFKYFSGFAEVDNNILSEMNFKLLSGRLPDGSKDEIAISEYVFEVFKKSKYSDGLLYTDTSGKQEYKYVTVSNYSDIIGKTLELGGKKYTVTGVIDTDFQIERYISLTEEKDYETRAESLIGQILYSEFIYASQYSYAGIAMVGNGFIERITADAPSVSYITDGYISFYSDKYSVDSNYLATLSDVKNEKIVWVSGAKTRLADNEIIVTTDILSIYEELTGEYSTVNDYYIDFLKTAEELYAHKQIFADDSYSHEDRYKVVGIIPVENESSKIRSTVVCDDSLFSQFTDGRDNIYNFAVGAMPETREEVKNMVSVCYNEEEKVRYPIQNSVTFELDSINEALKQMSKIFLYIGLGFAIFASVMLSNFIAMSISYKKQEIGILRAIGSRSNDVFRIFFAESFIIAMINFFLSALGVGIATGLINYFLRERVGILVTVLSFSPRQVILLLAVSILVAFVASYLPVKRIASKRPIDAIRDR